MAFDIVLSGGRDLNLNVKESVISRGKLVCSLFRNFITSCFDSPFLIGVLMWEVFSEGKIPYENRSNSEVVEDITTGFRLYKPRLASSHIYQIDLRRVVQFFSCCENGGDNFQAHYLSERKTLDFFF